jgi:hypothetical protein
MAPNDAPASAPSTGGRMPWKWIYRSVAVDPERGRATVHVRTEGTHEGGPETEWFDAQVVIARTGGRSEAATRLDALRRLRTLIDREMASLEHPPGDA